MNSADITILNLNMLYFRYPTRVEREVHVPLGPLYLTQALEEAGFVVDFRDYQCNAYDDVFSLANCVDYLSDHAPIVGLSVMANLLPFAILVAGQLKKQYPGTTVVLGGVGPAAVEPQILECFPAIDIIGYGEFERAGPLLLKALTQDGELANCPSIFFRSEGKVVRNPPARRIGNLDDISYPAYNRIEVSQYDAINVLTSRGCPFACTFCSVAPIWEHRAILRTADAIIDELAFLKKLTGRRTYLFQDEYFLASPERAESFSRRLVQAGVDVEWKAFGRVNLVTPEAMKLMARAGCIELRFGVESGSSAVLSRVTKGFEPEEALHAVSLARTIIPSVDAFFVWGYPFEQMDQFYESVFLMNALRMLGVRILPSLLCYLPQTHIYRELDKTKLEFSADLLPEYMLTGHEICSGAGVDMDPRYEQIYRLIRDHKDIFPGFYHYDIEHNIRPKLKVLQELGFYGKQDQPSRSGKATHSLDMLACQP